MRIKFIGQADLVSKGLQLIPGYEYEVSEEVYNYLKNTFGNVEVIEITKPQAKVEEKPKVNSKVTPKG